MQPFRSVPSFSDTFQEEIYDAFCNKLNPHNIQIIKVEHRDFQEIYFLEGDEGKAKLHVHYNKFAAVKRVILEWHTSEKIRDRLRLIFEP